MAETINLSVFTDAELALIKEMVHVHKTRRLNPPITVENDDSETVPIYIARPVDLEDGIPGLVPAGTFLDDTGNLIPVIDEPGVGLCEIYQIVETGEGFHSGMQSTGLIEEVYNLSESPIIDEYITIKRDGYGNFIAQTSVDEFEGVLLTWLDAPTGPLKGSTAGLMLVIQKNYPTNGQIADFIKAPIIRQFRNRAISLSGQPGTYGRCNQLNGEIRLKYLDCKPSEEGIQIVVEYEDTLINGGFGSGSYGDGTYGG